MQTMRMSILAGFAVAVMATRAEAQDTSYRLKEINFDMWCQEERHLPPERCDKRLPADDAEYQAYVAKIEQYEVPYLQHRDNEQTFNRGVLHGDPVDRPVEPSVPAANQPPPQN